MTAFPKDPNALLDYSVDWAPWLAADETVASAVVTVPAGLVKDRTETVAATGLITVWLSGGTAGVNYDVGFRITTSQGRVDERSMTVKVNQR